jgi:hypothetical protein
MPTQESDIRKIEEQRKSAASTARGAGGFEATATSLHGNVMEAVRADRAQRGISTLAQDVGTTSGQLVSDPIGIKERAGDIVDPTSVDFLTSRQRAQNLGTLGTQATALTQQEGDLAGVIEAEANSLLAQAKRKRAEAESEAQQAQDALEMLKFQSDEEQRRIENELAERRFSAQQADKTAPGTAEDSADFGSRYRTYLTALEETEGADIPGFKEDVIALSGAVRDGAMTVDEAMEQLALVYPISVDPATAGRQATRSFRRESVNSLVTPKTGLPQTPAALESYLKTGVVPPELEEQFKEFKKRNP